MSDSLCGSSQHCNSTPEQSVAAQSQHHQQYIGTDRGLVGSLNSCLSTDVSNLRSRTSASFMTHLFFFQKPVFLSDGWPHFFPLFADTSHTLPPFPSPDLGTQPLPERINMTDIKKLQTLYRDHCEVCPIWAQCFIIILYDPLKHYSNFRAEILKLHCLQAFVALDAARWRLIMLMSVLARRQKCESEKSGVVWSEQLCAC